MLEILFIIIGFIAVCGTIFYFWHFGKYGEWGDLVSFYKDKTPKFKGLFESEVIYIFINNKWRQWSYCSITYEPKGLRISQPRLINYLVPSVFIPHDDIFIGNTIKPWMHKYITLSFSKSKTKIALKYSHAEELNNLIEVVD